MMFFMLRILSAIKVASLEYLAPPTTMLIAYFMFDERLTAVDYGGIALAGIAVWLVIGNQSSEKPITVAEPPVNPLLEPPSFENQRFMSINKLPDCQGMLNPNTRLSSEGIDIDLGMPSSTNGILDMDLALQQSLKLNNQIDVLNKTLEEKNKEIEFLKQALSSTQKYVVNTI